MKSKFSVLALASVALGAGLFNTPVFAQGKCARIAVFETRGEKESADPAYMTETALSRNGFAPPVSCCGQIPDGFRCGIALPAALRQSRAARIA